jgi:formate hydrogenlyase subunit 3/multisubunit Na+/H+ antiporter MnhD subunit
MQSENVKKLLAFSTVSFMGLVLMAIALGTPMAVKAVFFLLAANALGKGLLFWAAGRMATDYRTADIEKWRTVENKPFSLVAAWFLGAATVIGLPLLPGFWGKLHFLGAAIEMGRWGKAGIAVLVGATAVEAVALLRAGHNLWEKPAAETEGSKACRFAPAYGLGILAFVAAIVWMGLAPGWSARSFPARRKVFAVEGDHPAVLTSLSLCERPAANDEKSEPRTRTDVPE